MLHRSALQSEAALSTDGQKRPFSGHMLQYLRLAGVFPVWRLVAYVLLLAYAVAVVVLDVDPAGAIQVMLASAPILAGTGLLQAAKEGRLDLLFGCGATRRRIWGKLFLLSVVMPAVLIGAYAFSFGTYGFVKFGVLGGTRAALIVLATTATCFALGFRLPGYTPGVIWLGTRIAFLLSPPGRAVYNRLIGQGVAPASLADVIIGFFGFPEAFLDPHSTVWAMVLPILVAGIASFVSYSIFTTQDFGGHRTV